MARAAGATRALNIELGNLSGQSVQADRSTQVFVRDLGNLNRESRGAERSINQLTGRLRLFADAAAIFGPGTVPVGGVLAAGVAGFASQLGFAAVAGGVLAGSMQGLGDALGAMNKAQLDPTNKNLEAAEGALKRLSPATRDFAEQLFDLKPALRAIRDMGAESLVPGLSEAFDDLERLGPRVAGIFQSVAGALGEIAADSASSLASERWADFFAMIQAEAPQALSEMASAIGDVVHGLSELWEAFAPLNSDFSGWLMGVADGFDRWATGLSATEGFAEFIDYIRETGPQVAETTGALANAIVQIVQASAPLGGPVLAAIEGFAKALGAIADSDLGTPIMVGVSALALYNRALATTAAMQKRVDAGGGLFGAIGTRQGAVKSSFAAVRKDVDDLAATWATAGARTSREQARMATSAASLRTNLGSLTREAGRVAGPIAGLAVVASGAADGIGLTNTASLALMGSFAGPAGVAIGAAAGALLDLRAAGDGATEAIQGLDAAVQSGDMNVLKDQIAAAKAELADIANLDFGGDIFDRIGFQLADTFGGPSMDDARAKIEASEQALADLEWQEKKAAIEAKGAALAFLQQTGANVDLAKWSGKTKEQIKAQADAIMESKEAADKTARSFVGLGDSLNDGKTSLGDWIKEMASSADALNNFTANSRRAAKRGLDDGLIRSLQAAGEEGALRMRQLANGTEAEIDRANAAFRKGEKAIERYNDYKVPPKVVKADISNAMAGFLGVDRYLATLDGKTATTYVNIGLKGAAAFSQNAWGDVKDRHHPEIADGRTMRVWAEPETQGESYIPHANDGRRPRAKRILEHTADKFGGQVLWFARGGAAGRPSAASLSPSPNSPGFTSGLSAWANAGRNLLRASQAQLDAAAGLGDAATKQRDAVQAQFDAVAQGTVSGFNSGLFDKSANPWAAGAGAGPLFNLNKDIAGLEERAALQEQLKGLGLTGNAAGALLTQGSNADIQALISSGGVGQYASDFARRESLQATVGADGGNLAHGQALHEANRAASEAAATVARIEDLLKQQEARREQRIDTREQRRAEREASNAERAGEAFGHAVNGAVANAARNNPRPRVSRP